MTFGSFKMKVHLLRSLRREKGLSQHDFAIKAGVSIRTYQRAENGKSVNIDTARAIAAFHLVDYNNIIENSDIEINIRDIDQNFRNDVNLLKQHRIVFERPAFTVACIFELFLEELEEAIDDTVAALNTGRLYSRNNRILGSFESINKYNSNKFKETFLHIVKHLVLLKRVVVSFRSFFRNANPGYANRQNFYSILMDSLRTTNESDLITIVEYMDEIDETRNDILSNINVLLKHTGEMPFIKIELSSVIIKQNGMGNSQLLEAISKKSKTKSIFRQIFLTDRS